MADRGKVIKGLECCILSDEECECLDECPYHDDCWETDCELGYILKKDALKLLKEQEAEKPKEVNIRCTKCKYYAPGDHAGFWRCENWGVDINRQASPPETFYCADGEPKEEET